MAADMLSPSDLQARLISPTVPRSEEVRTVWGTRTNMDRIESAMINAEAGYMVELTDLTGDILKLDPHMSACARKRFGALQAADYDVTAPQGIDRSDKKLADEIASKTAQVLRGLNSFPERICDLSWALCHGRASSEILWQAGAYGLPVAPVALQWIHPRRLSFDRRRRLHVTNAWGAHGFDPREETALANYPGKFLSWCPRLFNEYPEREGLAPRLIYWGFFKRFDWRMRMKLMELFGIPWRIIEVDAPGGGMIAPEALAQAHAEGERLGKESVGVIPRGMKLNVTFPPERSGQFFSQTSQEIDDQISLLWFGTKATNNTDPNRANAQVGKGEQDIGWQNDGVGVSWELTNGLARPIARAGWGPSTEHLASIITLRTQPPRDRKAELERFEKVMSFGIGVTEAQIREAAGTPAPTEEERYVVMGKAGTDPYGRPVAGAYKIVDPAAPKGGSAPPGGDPDPAPGGDPEGDPPAPGDAPEPGAPAANDNAEALKAIQSLLGLERCMHGIPLGASDRKEVPASAVNGSPETLVVKSTKEGLRSTSVWVDAYLAAVDGASAYTAPELLRRLQAAHSEIERTQLDGFARALEKRLVHALALGALDADWEAENDRVVKPPVFDVGLQRVAFVPSPAYPTAKALFDRFGRQLDAEDELLRLQQYGLVGGVADFATQPFAEAIKIFRAKNILPRKAFDRLTAEAKGKAFTVSGLTNKRMLETAHAELTKQLEEGVDLRTFRKSLAERFDAAGWTQLNPSHVENVFRTNIMGAYNGGRDVQMRQPHVVAARPFWQILGVSDARTRPHHKAVLKKVLRWDDPFWKRAAPPFGYQCRCRKVSRSAEVVKSQGLEVVDGSSIADLPDEGFESGALF